ncbi:MAG: TonB-dependent receptor [Ferruginibacter sp.]
MKRVIVCFSLFLLKNNALLSQTVADTVKNVFTLGEVKVVGYKTEPFTTVISSEKNEQQNRMDVSHSLNLLPGINLSAIGPRNESGVYVRGFDLRQVPVYIDGIPEYVPYDGYVDLARFTVFDIAEVQVAKGYSSVLYGPNALGGAINLVSRKPVKKFEANAIAGWLSGGYKASVNVGSAMGKFYWQVAAAQLKRDYFPMSKSFDTTKRENGDRRDNSYSDDIKISGKIGFTPVKGQEFVLGYVYQKGKKGTPVYTGSDTLNSLYKSPRYWQWPNWDKQTFYLIANNRIDSNNIIRTRIYYDQFKNGLYSYDDATYTTITKPYAFKSIYDDYSVGGSVAFSNTAVANNSLSLAFHFKQDVHREHNVGEPVRKMSDNNITAAVEDNYRINRKLVAVAGFSYMKRSSLVAQGYNSTSKEIFDYANNDNNAWNLQGGLLYNFTNQRSLNFSVARKTRFATMKDRYSFRMGTAIPNPDLIAESAVNYQLNYRDALSEKFFVKAGVFYSKINNTIQMVSNVKFDSVASRWLSQQQNTGKSEFYGAEAELGSNVTDKLFLSANYSYIVRNNLSNNKIKFTDVPSHKVFVTAMYKPVSKLAVTANAEYNSNRFSTSYGTVSKSFTTVNARVYYDIYKYFSVETGVNNIFDKNYTLVEGYPEPGRNYFASVIFNF